MDADEKELLAQYRDWSDVAVARRLRAARMIASPNQKEFARALDMTVTTYNSQEVKGRPSIEVLNYLYRNARVGPNFILFGEIVPLNGDVQIALIDALRAIDSGAAKKSSAD